MNKAPNTMKMRDRYTHKQQTKKCKKSCIDGFRNNRGGTNRTEPYGVCVELSEPANSIYFIHQHHDHQHITPTEHSVG